MGFSLVDAKLRQLALLTATMTVLGSCASSSAPSQQIAVSSPLPASRMTADTAKLDIANVTLGMDADQATTALRAKFGQNIMDNRITDQSILDVLKINKDMNYPKNKIYYSVHLPNEKDKGIYPNHIFYNIFDTYTGTTSVIIDLAKSPGQENGPAKVYQILEVTRGGIPGPVFEEVSTRVAGKYGFPTMGNQWCAELVDGKCPADKPHLALFLIRDPHPDSINSVLQLFDPGYGVIGPEGVNSSEDLGTLSFERHT